MAFRKKALSSETQARLREMAEEVRGLLYGEAGCPEWGTRFSEIESDGMLIGLELARLVMEQSVGEQADRMPASKMTIEGDDVIATGEQTRELQTEAGSVKWEQPCGYQKKGRKAFFPSDPGAGTGG
jgi:hypothetical protein